MNRLAESVRLPLCQTSVCAGDFFGFSLMIVGFAINKLRFCESLLHPASFP